jgi:hypothetical protein
MSEVTDAIVARAEERQRILDIVRKRIGFAALEDDIPDEFPCAWFRALYAGIEEEVRDANRTD